MYVREVTDRYSPAWTAHGLTIVGLSEGPHSGLINLAFHNRSFTTKVQSQ